MSALHFPVTLHCLVNGKRHALTVFGNGIAKARERVPPEGPEGLASCPEVLTMPPPEPSETKAPRPEGGKQGGKELE